MEMQVSPAPGCHIVSNWAEERCELTPCHPGVEKINVKADSEIALQMAAL